MNFVIKVCLILSFKNTSKNKNKKFFFLCQIKTFLFQNKNHIRLCGFHELIKLDPKAEKNPQEKDCGQFLWADKIESKEPGVPVTLSKKNIIIFKLV